MPLFFNLHQLEQGPLALEGELSAAELELENFDELVQLSAPTRCRLEAQLIDGSVLVKGRVIIPLDCACSRCLRAFKDEVDIQDWACLLPLNGEDHVEIHGDSVNLTPYVREDIVLALPQHPLCRPQCEGLSFTALNQAKQVSTAPRMEATSTVWAELNKLKLEK